MIGHQTPKKKIQFVYEGFLIAYKTIFVTSRYALWNGPKRRENLKTFKGKRKIVKAMYKLIYWPRKSFPIFF